MAIRCISLLILSLISHINAAINTTNLPENVYLFSYFENSAASDGLRVAYSTDGYTFTAINDGKPLLPASIGDKILRDPCLLYGPDNVFRLVWTTAWWSKEIGYASSKDLKTWSTEELVPVMKSEAQAQNSWAPEVVYDAAKKDYLIYWSTTVIGKFTETANPNNTRDNHRIYSTTTTDFKTYTPTKLFYDGNFNEIDATLLHDTDHNRWLMFIKNEAADQKNIHLVTGGESIDGPWGKPGPALTNTKDFWAEGPTAIKIGNYYHVYFDKYQKNQMGLIRSTDLNTWEDVSSKVHFPAKTSHGTVLRVSRDVLTMIAKAGL